MARAILGLEQATALVGRLKKVTEGQGAFLRPRHAERAEARELHARIIAEISQAMQTMGNRCRNCSGPGEPSRQRHRDGWLSC